MTSQTLAAILLAATSLVAAPAAQAQDLADAGAKAKAQDYRLMVFITPKEGRGGELLDYYHETHLREVVDRPTFQAGQFFTAETAPHDNITVMAPAMARYDFTTNDLPALLAQDAQISADARLPDPPHQPKLTRSLTMLRHGPLLKGPGADWNGKGPAVKYHLFCLADAAGDPKADACGTAVALKLPGTLTVQKYERASQQRYSGTESPERMMEFVLLTDDLDGWLSALNAGGATLPTGGTLGEDAPASFIYREMGAKLTD